MSLFDISSTRAQAAEAALSTEAAAIAAAAQDEEPDTEDSTADIDPDKLQHDIGVVQGITADALAQMAEWGITVSHTERLSAQKVIPKACVSYLKQ
jgi:hypothetical protein